MQTQSLIEVLFQHQDFIVINKPAPLSFHDEQSPGLVSLVTQSLAHLSSTKRFWPVHRLDKITSGCIIFACNAAAAKHFEALFSERLIEKVYLAISNQKPKKKQGSIIGDMQKSRGGSWKLVKTKTNPAITAFKTYSIEPNIRLFKVSPKTGKTHQIRVALKSLGAPILGDTRYKGEQSDRAYLHAYSLRFNWHNQPIKVQCNPTTGHWFTHLKTTEILHSVET
ncbi:TIGR01621 family pseudouridine synthase [Aliikangiella sp. IMCC44653]